MKHTTTALALLLLSSLFASCKKEEDAPPPCSYILGDWSAWEDGVRTRSVIETPEGCTGTLPEAMQLHPCLTDGHGFISVRNNTSNAYSVTLNGSTDDFGPFTMGSGSEVDSIPLNIGSYTLEAVQLTGYVVTPTVYTATTFLSACEDRVWSYP